MKTIKFLLTAITLVIISQHSNAEIVSQQLLENMKTGETSYLVIGDTYTYYNIINYDDMYLRFTPYPWQDGRVRYGKYKSSAKALDDYMNSLRAMTGKKFKLEKMVKDVDFGKDIYPPSGVILTDEKGDSIFYSTSTYYSFAVEFVNDTFWAELNKLVGKTIINTENFKATESPGNYPGASVYSMFTTINDSKSKKSLNIEALTEWKVTKIAIDTTYYGEHNLENDQANSVMPRFTLYVSNEIYGDCFFYLYLLNKLFIIKK